MTTAPPLLALIPCPSDCQDGTVEEATCTHSLGCDCPTRSVDCSVCHGSKFVDEADCDICGENMVVGMVYEHVYQPPAGVTYTMILCRACIAEALNVCGICWQPEVGGGPATADAESGLPTCAACRAKGEEEAA